MYLRDANPSCIELFHTAKKFLCALEGTKIQKKNDITKNNANFYVNK